VVLLAFFNSQEHFQVSDEQHQIFAKYYIDDLCFLYKDSEHEDRKVHESAWHPAHISDEKQCNTEMEGAILQPIGCPNVCYIPHSYRRHSEGSQPP
jgi:hypothetical protein